MFYSQFILAKKGPLGTIWIAAHLERKLRKNQVADTDIGVSVDSILFPEAPIALRLSSHLLLGVVRIYSRKVNYLFDDCSEALLKIKQAFRSTAVDLPPEESKAPYHSITLPETFDLDDFELPDNEFFQGNYVDHHISSREQITLQDNMENIVYSTSQFGLDERFGDGDTSGLDLDEELFLDKVNAAGHTGLSVDPQTSMQPIMPLKRHEHVDRMPTISEARIEAASGDADLMDYAQAPCTPGLVEEPNLSNVQETSACDDHMESEDNILTESAVKENMKTDSCKSNVNQGSAHVVDWSLPADTNSVAVRHKPCEENGYHSSDLRIKRGHSLHPEVNIEHISSDDPASASGTSFVAAKEVITSPEPNLAENVIAASDNLDKREELQNGLFKIDGVDGLSIDSSNKGHGECNGIISKESVRDNSCLSSPHQQVPEGISNNNQEECTNGVIAGNSEKPYSPSGALGLDTELQAISCLGKTENGVSQESVDSDLLNLSVQDEMQCAQVHHLRPCSAGMGPLDSSNDQGEQSNDLSSEIDANPPLEACEGGLLINASGSVAVEQGKNFHEVDDSEQNVTENRAAEHALLEVINPGSGKSDDQVNVVGGDGTLQNVNIPAGMDFPPPEKLLSLPEGFVHEPKDLLVEATPGDLAGVDESDAGSRIISGKKRSYTESTLTEQSLNSVESSRIVSTKRTAEAIPDDDDLLSSILVGRRSSVLKVKPTPPPSEITSVKRHRSGPRTSASKRKVLVDDTMVLHGDTIRQQLMNTEDIRRIRKKAPCTRPEIAMIQKQYLEEEIFGEPICSGASMELASLHNQKYDLHGITISLDDVSDTSLLAGTDMKLTSGNDKDVRDFGIGNVNVLGEPSTAVAIDREGVSELVVVGEMLQLVETSLPTDNRMDEVHDVVIEADITQPQMKYTKAGIVAAMASSSQLEHSQYLPENTFDGGSCSIVEAVDPALPTEIESYDHFSGDVGPTLDGVVQMSQPDKSSAMDAAVLSSDEKREMECVQVNASLIDGSNGRIDDEEGTVKDDVAAVETEPAAAEDVISLEANQHGAIVDTERNSNEQGDYNGWGPSIEIETDFGRVEYHDQLFCEGTSAEQPIDSSSYPAECLNAHGSKLDDWEYAMQHQPYPENAIDAEICGIDVLDRDDLNFRAAANDTEFLNVDDDEVAEVTDDYTPNPEEILFTENSGWSSRTRAVAKYLQALFIKEAECGRKALPMDNLLVGKTRKEASRMFFEALVLKTRDYIHVEQERPFDNIALKPRMKLMKPDF